MKKAVSLFKNCRVENIYGPTEASIYAAYFGCGKGDIASHHTPIGKPVSNTKIYIVDQHLKPVPIGKPGELCIAGAGLARGYFKKPGLTAEKFIDNPFEPGTKLYKSGDSARWLPDGNIEYLGRIDSQVKIRGFRVELGAIETKLGEFPGILDQAVVVKQLEVSTARCLLYRGKRTCLCQSKRFAPSSKIESAGIYDTFTLYPLR